MLLASWAGSCWQCWACAGRCQKHLLAAVCFPRRSERGTRKGRAVCSLNQCDQKEVVVYSPRTMLVPRCPTTETTLNWKEEVKAAEVGLQKGEGHLPSAS